MIPIGQKNTLAEYMILSGADNRPPMLDKDLVSKDLWERIQLLMQGRQNSYAAGTSGTRANTSRTGGRTSGQQRVVKCFNYQREGHMARQCTEPKRKRDASWFREKVLLVEAQGKGKVLTEEELECLANPELSAEQAFWFQMSNPTTDSLDASPIKVDVPTELPMTLWHTMEQAATLREIVEQAKSLNPLDSASYTACKYVKLIQELLGYVRDTCPNIHKPSEKLVVVTPKNKVKITSTTVVPRKKTTRHSEETQKPELKDYFRRPKQIKNVGSSKKGSPDCSLKSYRIYNQRTQKFIETIHVDFDELTAMTYEQLDSGSGLQSMTPATSIPVTTAPRVVDLANSPVSTLIDQDDPLTSIPSTQEQEHYLIISQGFVESPKTPHFHDDPLHKSLHEDSTSQGSSSNVRPIHTLFESLGRWTKDHPIANVISDPSRFVSTKKQLQTDAMFCYFNAFLTSIEPNNFKQGMIKPSWIDAMQEEIHELERLQV
uniref:Integrase, catalytic region, zinc finger, CCHC-type, peptidase aspartic, catalytic n=1 Tax=Tanacetum cinerariifolium TaxID=118510 RepID=A0A699GKY5_TANCI|nr:hypothetical protein [Tanacetum cinerariifolium]